MKKNRLIIIIAALSLIIAAAALNFLPDEIALHFGMDGNADRIGSKYEIFMFPGIVIVLSAVGILLRSKLEKKQKNASDEKEAVHAASNYKILGIVVAAACAVTVGLECLMIGMAWSGIQTVSGTEGELYCSLSCVLVGIMLAVLGNVMPKLKMNGAMGLRTTWSMKNEEVWARSQRLGGMLAFFAGVAIIVEALILRGYASLFVMMALILAAVIASVVGSRKIYKDWKKEHNA